MNTQKIYQVDAFTTELFGGNPAAVCPLKEWLRDGLLQQIAMENNLSETVFYVKENDRYIIRWFTPTIEIDLCGHATLAAAFVLFYHENHSSNVIHFYSPKSGELIVRKDNNLITLNFPANTIESIPLTQNILSCFDIAPQSVFKSKTFYMCVFNNEKEIKNINPEFNHIKNLKANGILITAQGDDVDFVSRFFAPQIGVDEDPVTGSTHTILIPYWAQRLEKKNLKAIQLSQRKGVLQCSHLNDRVEMSGHGKLYLIGNLFLA